MDISHRPSAALHDHYRDVCVQFCCARYVSCCLTVPEVSRSERDQAGVVQARLATRTVTSRPSSASFNLSNNHVKNCNPVIGYTSGARHHTFNDSKQHEALVNDSFKVLSRHISLSFADTGNGSPLLHSMPRIPVNLSLLVETNAACTSTAPLHCHPHTLQKQQKIDEAISEPQSQSPVSCPPALHAQELQLVVHFHPSVRCGPAQLRSRDRRHRYGVLLHNSI